MKTVNFYYMNKSLKNPSWVELTVELAAIQEVLDQLRSRCEK